MPGKKKGKSKKRRKFSRNKSQNEAQANKTLEEVELDKTEEIRLVLSQNNIPILDEDDFEKDEKSLMEESTSKGTPGQVQTQNPDPPKFPEPCFKILDNYNIPDLDVRPEGYIRFIERTEEELDEMVEYDMDEEDMAWLEIINEKRAEDGFELVSPDAFEILMDRLEKESFFESVMTPEQQAQVKEDEALCSICGNGESLSPNAIIFCDMCNLAVHQDCYGVPYIPEGQWLCRRCLHSPSQSVDCVLCPNSLGAFKQTDRGHWAHIVCALWIPEVHFANPVFLEPIYNINNIPPTRWKLMCYICKQRTGGACIQCSKKNCNLAFHATCAQMEGLYMQPNNRTEHFTIVGRTVYCQNHSPENNNEQNFNPQKKIKHVRNHSPIVSFPTVPADRIQEISSRVILENKSKFIKRILAYWMLKRQLRHGVPLLRRLYHLSQREETKTTKNVDLQTLQNQLAYWRRLRQDFERVRLLCELVRKREKKKRELIHVKSVAIVMELCPMIYHLRRLLDLIKSYDIHGIFLKPVDIKQVPGYYEYIKNPMDLTTMSRKVDQFKYSNFEEFKQDFNLMIDNCVNYNEKNTVYYKTAIKLRNKCTELFEGSEKDLETMAKSPGIFFGLTPEGIKEEVLTDPEEEKYVPPAPVVANIQEPLKVFTALDFDKELENFVEQKSCLTRKERLQRLDELVEKVQLIKNYGLRSKRISKLKKLIYITKKLQKGKRKRNSKKSISEEVEEKFVGAAMKNVDASF